MEDRHEGSGFIKVHLNKIGNAKEVSAIRIDDYPAIIFPDGKVIEFSGKKWESMLGHATNVKLLNLADFKMRPWTWFTSEVPLTTQWVTCHFH